MSTACLHSSSSRRAASSFQTDSIRSKSLASKVIYQTTFHCNAKQRLMDVDDPPVPLAVLWSQLQSPSKRSEQIASGQEWCKANVKWRKGRKLLSWNGLKVFDAFRILQPFLVTPAFNAAAIASCSASPSGVVWASASADSRPDTPVMPRQLRRKNWEARKWNALQEIFQEIEPLIRSLLSLFSRSIACASMQRLCSLELRLQSSLGTCKFNAFAGASNHLEPPATSLVTRPARLQAPFLCLKDEKNAKSCKSMQNLSKHCVILMVPTHKNDSLGISFPFSEWLPSARLCSCVSCSVRESLTCCSLSVVKSTWRGWGDLVTKGKPENERDKPRLRHFCSILSFSSLPGTKGIARCVKRRQRITERMVPARRSG